MARDLSVLNCPAAIESRLFTKESFTVRRKKEDGPTKRKEKGSPL
jgi:hypothetical protein